MNQSLNKRVFILNGVHRSGKDTFVRYLNDIGIYAVHYSYVDFTREMLKSKGIDINNKSNKLRKLLCDVNNALEEYDDIPFKDCLDIVDNFYQGWLEGDWLFIDCREPKKIERLKQAVNAKTVFIKSNEAITANNSADKAVASDYKYDYAIENIGTLEDFYNNISLFLNEFIHEDDDSLEE